MVAVLDAATGNHGKPRGDRVLASGQLVARRLKRPRVRPDKDDAGRRAGPGKPRVLRQETVAGVDRVGSGGDGRADDRVHAEVASRRGGQANANDPVREPSGNRVGVGVRDGEHRLDAKQSAGPDHPRGDLPPVRDQHPPQHHPIADPVTDPADPATDITVRHSAYPAVHPATDATLHPAVQPAAVQPAVHPVVVHPTATFHLCRTPKPGQNRC
jgi:hypothetical protein